MSEGNQRLATVSGKAQLAVETAEIEYDKYNHVMNNVIESDSDKATKNIVTSKKKNR